MPAFKVLTLTGRQAWTDDMYKMSHKMLRNVNSLELHGHIYGTPFVNLCVCVLFVVCVHEKGCVSFFVHAFIRACTWKWCVCIIIRVSTLTPFGTTRTWYTRAPLWCTHSIETPAIQYTRTSFTNYRGRLKLSTLVHTHTEVYKRPYVHKREIFKFYGN